MAASDLSHEAAQPRSDLDCLIQGNFELERDASDLPIDNGFVIALPDDEVHPGGQIERYKFCPRVAHVT